MVQSTPELGLPPSPLPPRNEATAEQEIRERADSVATGLGAGGFPSILKVSRQRLKGPHGRVAIVDGCRTPFAQAGTELKELDAIDLAGIAAGEAVARCGFDPAEIDVAIFGIVLAPLYAPNLGREVIFRAALPASIPGTTVNLACASSNRAITTGAESILLGEAEVVLAGGAESLSNVPLAFSKPAAERFLALSKARTAGARLAPPRRLPAAPLRAGAAGDRRVLDRHDHGRGLREDGQGERRLAARPGRDRPDVAPARRGGAGRGALRRADGRRSSRRRATTGGSIATTACAATARSRRSPRSSRSSTDATARSPPATRHRSPTAAPRWCSMSERRARALGRAPLGFVRSYAYTAIPPGGQLLQGPAYAAPLALERAGLKLSDIDLVETHEAFAAQALSNLKAMASAKFAREELGRSEPVGEVDLARWNVNGGSIALGHPFGATGARVTLQLLCELRRRGLQHGLITVCAAGGHGFAMVVERE